MSVDEVAGGTRLRPPVPYYGGKQRVAGQVAALLPAHGHYVEPFAGGLSVLLTKAPSAMETVNDLDADVVTFWRVLRDRPTELVRVCALSPHSRADHAQALAEPAGEVGEVERARRVWVRLTQGRAAMTRARTGWRNYTSLAGSATGMPAYLRGYLERMTAVAERLQQVSLECRPALEVIASYGRHGDVLLYVDPPYPGVVRAAGGAGYRHEMRGEPDHRELAEALHTCPAAVVVSGYPCPLYDEDLYAGWHRVELAASTTQGRTNPTRTEVLWSNRPLGIQPALFLASDAEIPR